MVKKQVKGCNRERTKSTKRFRLSLSIRESWKCRCRNKKGEGVKSEWHTPSFIDKTTRRRRDGLSQRVGKKEKYMKKEIHCIDDAYIYRALVWRGMRDLRGYARLNNHEENYSRPYIYISQFSLAPPPPFSSLFLWMRWKWLRRQYK